MMLTKRLLFCVNLLILSLVHGGGHAYLEWLDLYFSYDGLDYQKLMRFEARDQLTKKRAVVALKDKKKGTSLMFFDSSYPRNSIVWYDATNMFVECTVFSNIGCVGITWFVRNEGKIKDVLVHGNWHVNGLYCEDKIPGEVYEIEKITVSKTEVKTNLKPKYINTPDVETLKKNEVNVLKDADEVVIKGVDPSENIKVYTTSGTQIKSIITNNHITKIKLPVNQIYIISIAQTRNKIVL